MDNGNDSNPPRGRGRDTLEGEGASGREIKTKPKSESGIQTSDLNDPFNTLDQEGREKRQKSLASLANLKPFTGGPDARRGPGNKDKLAKREQRVLRDYARTYNREAIDKLVEMMRFCRAPKVQLGAAVELLDRGLGKPKVVDYTEEIDDETGEDLADTVIDMILDKHNQWVQDDKPETDDSQEPK